MFLLSVCAFVCRTLRAEFLDCLFVARILGHIPNIGLDIVATGKRLPGLLILEISGKFVQPGLLIIFSLLSGCHGSSRHLTLVRCCGRPLFDSLLLYMNERLFERVHSGFSIDKGGIVPGH